MVIFSILGFIIGFLLIGLIITLLFIIIASWPYFKFTRFKSNCPTRCYFIVWFSVFTFILIIWLGKVSAQGFIRPFLIGVIVGFIMFPFYAAKMIRDLRSIEKME